MNIRKAKFDELARLLWSDFMSTPDCDLAPQIRNWSGTSDELVVVLSRLERQVTCTKLHRSIALFKAILRGEDKEEEFVRCGHELAGLI